MFTNELISLLSWWFDTDSILFRRAIWNTFASEETRQPIQSNTMARTRWIVQHQNLKLVGLRCRDAWKEHGVWLVKWGTTIIEMAAVRCEWCIFRCSDAISHRIATCISQILDGHLWWSPRRSTMWLHCRGFRGANGGHMWELNRL